MAERRRYLAAGSVAAGVLGARALVRAGRRGGLRQALTGAVDAVMPSARRSWPVPATRPHDEDEAHAPGHAHLQPPARAALFDGPPARARPFAKHRHGLRHPGRG